MHYKNIVHSFLNASIKSITSDFYSKYDILEKETSTGKRCRWKFLDFFSLMKSS